MNWTNQNRIPALKSKTKNNITKRMYELPSEHLVQLNKTYFIWL